MDKYIAVYGTLRKNHANHSIMQDSVSFVGMGRIKAKMFKCGGFPGIVLDENCTSICEVYRLINDEVIMTLDRYEGYFSNNIAGSLFVRAIAQIVLDDGTVVDATVYLYNQETSTLKHIESGDYFNQ